MSKDLIAFLRQYKPGMTREEVAHACGISIATLTRRLREGLDADEVIRAATYVGASPTEALIALGLLAPDDVRKVAATDALDTVSSRVLLEELLERAIAEEGADEHDREAAGLPPSPPRRLRSIDLSYPRETIRTPAAASDADIDREVEAHQEGP